VLTAQSDDRHASDVGIPGEVQERPLGLFVVGADLCAPVVVGRTDGALGGVGDALGDDVRADDRRRDEDVVPDADVAVGSAVRVQIGL